MVFRIRSIVIHYIMCLFARRYQYSTIMTLPESKCCRHPHRMAFQFRAPDTVPTYLVSRASLPMWYILCYYSSILPSTSRLMLPRNTLIGDFQRRVCTRKIEALTTKHNLTSHCIIKESINLCMQHCCIVLADHWFYDYRLITWLDLVIVELRLQLFGISQFTDGSHQILLDNIIAFLSDGKHAGFRANVTQISPIEAIW